MTNFAKSRAEIEGMVGDHVIVPKEQLLLMLAKAEVGERAERVLGSIVTVAGLGIRELKGTA